MWVQIPPREGAILMAEMARPGHARTCPTVNVFKATQQGPAQVQCGCQMGCTRLGCTLAPPSEYD